MGGMSKPITFEELALSRQEDAAARSAEFAGLVTRQARFLFRVAYSVLRNVSDTEDVVQEVFLKLYRTGAWERLDDERAFLARTVWRVAVDHLNRRPRSTPSSEKPWPGQNPEDAAISSNWKTILVRLVDALPEEIRQPLALSSVDGLSSPEIARIMGIPEPTVRTRLLRARRILKQKLAALGAGRHET